MDPTAAISLVCNTIQLTEVAIKCIKTAREIYKSPTGLSNEAEQLQTSTNELNIVLNKVCCDEELRNSSVEDANIRTVAKECRDLSSNIATLIDKRRPKKVGSRYSVIHAAIRAPFNENELKTTQYNLEKRQEILHLALTESIRTKIIGVEKAFKEGHVRSGNLQQQFSDIQRSLDTLSEVPYQFQQTLNLFHKAQQEQILRHVLRTLDNTIESNPRYDEVGTAYGNTFEWIFCEPGKVFKAEPGLSISFVDWLRKGKDIFHILGKPGSGKSTLMKFIWNHKERENLLREWAGGPGLLCMRYFFWKPGSGQNGLQDLKRSLLRSALKQAPELLKSLLPRLSEDNTTLDGHLGDNEISEACNKLMGDTRVPGKHKIFLFIDGLDEFDEERSTDDFHDLTRTIQDWTSRSEGNVKACVSSREYDVFRSISNDQKFHLQNLTREDMELFVTKRLEEHSRFSTLEDACRENTHCLCRPREKAHRCNLDCLIRHIVDKAHGVFLWVWLMILETRRHMECSLEKLWELVNAKPEKLTKFLVHTLDSIPSRYQREAYILLAAVHKYATFNNRTTGRSVHFFIPGASYLWNKLLQDEKGSDFQQYDASEFVNWDIFTTEEVDGHFNGLLERSQSEYHAPDYLSFTHRSIIEVLDECIDEKLCKYRITQSELGESICQTCLGNIIFFQKEIEDIRSDASHFIQFYLQVTLSILRDMNLQEEPGCMRQLDRIEDIHGMIHRRVSGKECQFTMPPRPLLIYLSTHKSWGFLPWILKRLDSELKQGHFPFQDIFEQQSFRPEVAFEPGHLAILAELLKRRYVGVDITESDSGQPISKNRCHTSNAWVTYVVQQVWYGGSSSVRYWDVCEVWLESGANPRILIPERNGDSIFVKVKGRWWCSYRERHPREPLWRLTGKFSQPSSEPKSTLRDFIEHSEADNKERLLELIDRNTAWIEADEAAEALAIFEELPSADVLDLPYYVLLPKIARAIRKAYIPGLRHMFYEIKGKIIGRNVIAQQIYRSISRPENLGIAVLAFLVLAVSIAIGWIVTSDLGH
ncbi:hypothetical protein F4805DRAFT_11147 [Annulohypoxylon moriforme]|nr:hypothetical protein F4805DRAFT_11147 [Annulohypoxylon moriforme]